MPEIDIFIVPKPYYFNIPESRTDKILLAYIYQMHILVVHVLAYFYLLIFNPVEVLLLNDYQP